MSVFRPQSFICECGATLTVQLAESVNAGARPQLRQAILDGTLHRATCDACGRLVTVETSFVYSDFPRDLLLMVLAPEQADREQAAVAEVERLSSLVPEPVTTGVVIGLDGLRERLIAQDAGLDEASTELLKAAVVHQHPSLTAPGPLRLALDAADAGAIELAGRYEDDPRIVRARLPRETVAQLEAGTRDMPRPLGPRRHFWARLWPWSGTPAAVAELHACAAAVLRARWPDVEGPAFRGMLARLPRGAQLPKTARADLRTLLDFAKRKGLQQLQDDLFEIRFGFALDDGWSQNDDPDDIETLWRVLDGLPEPHVAGSGWIREIDLDPDGDGKLAGSYRTGSREISIASTELRSPDSFRRVVRHEVGHAVHASKEQAVSDWLEKRFGWRTFALDDAGIDAWVQLAGGWDGLWEDDRRRVRAILRAAIGPGSCWAPAPLPDMPGSHPWCRPDFGPRLAFERTGPDWYVRCRTWHHIGGKAVFLNYWYGAPMAVDLSTLDIVARMPRSFAAMSPREFFAELYALYYDREDRRRDDLPDDVTGWMARNVGPAIAR